MKFPGIILAAALAVMCSACEQSNNPSAARTYSADWVQFEYPGDWALSEQEQEELHTIKLQGPGEALLQIFIHPDGSSEGVEAFARDFVAKAGSQGSTFSPTGRPGYQGVLHGWREAYSNGVVFYEREYQQVSRDGQTAFLVSQVDQANKLTVQTGFDRVFTTFQFK